MWPRSVLEKAVSFMAERLKELPKNLVVNSGAQPVSEKHGDPYGLQ